MVFISFFLGGGLCYCSVAFVCYIVYLRFSPLLLVFILFFFSVSLVLAKRLARKSVSHMTYVVSSGTLNLNPFDSCNHQAFNSASY